jgi:transposase
VTLLGISKRGDAYLRTLIVHGARVVLRHAKDPGPWLEQLCTAGLVARSVEQRKNLLERRPSPTGLPGLSVTAP